MAECKDCYCVEIFSLPVRGNGECKNCYGTGKSQGLDAAGEDFFGLERTDCTYCNGTGDCQTCGGTGEVEEEPEAREDETNELDEEPTEGSDGGYSGSGSEGSGYSTSSYTSAATSALPTTPGRTTTATMWWRKGRNKPRLVNCPRMFGVVVVRRDCRADGRSDLANCRTTPA
jgi:hypothetical protein